MLHLATPKCSILKLQYAACCNHEMLHVGSATCSIFLKRLQSTLERGFFV